MTNAFNILYQNGNSNDIWYDGTASITNLTESDTLKRDPDFISTTNFRLQASSPAINAGTDVSLTSDYDGNPIVGIVDIGAFEYQTLPVATTGLGWEDVLSKRDFKDDVNLPQSRWMIAGIPVTATASELNALVGQGQIISGIDTLSLSNRIDLKADTVDQSFTGTTEVEELSAVTSVTTPYINTDVLKVGADGATIDSITRVLDGFQVWDGATQLSPDIPVGGYAELGDYAVLKEDVQTYDVRSYGASPLGVIDATAAIQEACDSAWANDGKVVGAGTFLISDSIVIRSHADFSQATFNIDSETKCAVMYIDSLATRYNKTVKFPTVNQTHAHTNGVWSGKSIGIKIVNGNGCTFHINGVYKFKTGVLITSYGAHGSVYSTYYPDRIIGNEINLKLSPSSDAGWVNDNLFVGGQLGCYSADGTGVVGTRALLIDSANNIVNNNIFLKTGFEGNLFQYNVECYGAYNKFIGCRWESTTPKLLYSEKSATNYPYNNTVEQGYNSQSIVITKSAHATRNHLYTGTRLFAEGRAAFTGNNTGSNTYPTFAAVSSAWDLATSPETVYGWGAGYTYMGGKVSTDTYPRYQFTNATGALTWGSGSAAGDAILSRSTTNTLKIDSSLIVSKQLVLNGRTSGAVTIIPNKVAGTVTMTLPAATGTLLSSASFPTTIGIACSDETTALTASTSVAKVTFRMPYAMTVTAVRASVTTAPTDATILVDIHESGTTILSTKMMIDATELTSTTATTPYVISDTALADDASITLFVDQIGSSVAGAGLKVWIIGTRIIP
jgi:hypothetical protein